MIFPRSINNTNLGHQVHLAEKTSPSALPQARRVIGIRIEAGCLKLSDPELVLRHSTPPNWAKATIPL